MKVLVLHNGLGDNPSVDEQDVLLQRDTVVAALSSTGNEASTFGCTLDLEAVRRKVLDRRPDAVFNLVESLGETDRLMSLVPLLLEALQVPFTGAGSAAMLATSNKQRAKETLVQSGLPTPAWLGTDGSRSAPVARMIPQWIIKPVWEHASLGMSDDAVVEPADEDSLARSLLERQERCGRPMLAEEFIDGREFNLSLLDGDVLPPAEIDFGGFPLDKPRIVGHRAKWDVDSFEYQQTPRRFSFPARDNDLLATLQDLSRRCWELFKLTGFARIDFRVDEEGQPWILEVNVNPCLSPDAGFAAALAEARIPLHDAIGRIVNACVQPDCAANGTG